MIWRNTILAAVLALQQYALAAPTWPASIDELEDIMLLNSGYRARGFATAVTPCSAPPPGLGPGRIASAEWIRVAFHDMATANTYQGTGGIDASIMFETTRGENAGQAFNTTLTTYTSFFSSRTSMSDLISLGVYTATRSCGGPAVPIRGGHVDAKQAGDQGVPQPGDGLTTFRNRYLRFGFGTDEQMIQFTACGHTLGGVHASNFPAIVAPGTVANDYGLMDSTSAVFDNRIAVEYVAGNTTDPLSVGISRADPKKITASDDVVFKADKNVTISAMRDPTTFANVCKNMFQKMIETVPPTVTLTDIVTPYDIKPYDLQLTLLGSGVNISFTGDIRVRTTTRSAASISQVQLVYKDRTGASVSTPISTASKGAASGFDDSFSFYGFSAQFSADTSISSFNVVITLASGATETWDNNGKGFRIDDTVIYQTPQSCLDATGNLNVVAAVRSGAPAPTMSVVVKVPRSYPIVPSLSTATAPMATQSAVGSYQLYSASYKFSESQARSAVFGISNGNSSDNYKNSNNLPTACAPLATPTASPTLSSSSVPASSSRVLLSSVRSSDSTIVIASTSTTQVTSAVTIPASSSATNTTALGSAFVSSSSIFSTPTPGVSSSSGSATVTSTIQASSAQISSTAPISSSVVSTLSSAISSGFSPSVNSSRFTSASVSSVTSSTSTSSSSTPTPSGTPSFPNYNYTGCITDSTSDRTFTAKGQSISANSYESCAAFCSTYMYFGVEYGSECYCGNALPSYAVTHNDSECNMPCTGNSSQVCGASNRLTIFRSLTLYPVPANPTIAGYNYIGCHTDNVSNRVLGDSFLFAHNMTVPMCDQFCGGKKYFGVEYGEQCFCGDVLGSASTTTEERECAMECPGDPSSFCGAGDRIGVWKKN